MSSNLFFQVDRFCLYLTKCRTHVLCAHMEKNCAADSPNFALRIFGGFSNFELRLTLLSSVNNLISQNY